MTDDLYGMGKTHKQNVLRFLGLPQTATPSLATLANLTGVPKAVLEEIESRGAGAWRTNIASVRLKGSFVKNPNLAAFPRSARLSEQQWAKARVYAFLDFSPTFFGPDSDLLKKVPGLQ